MLLFFSKWLIISTYALILLVSKEHFNSEYGLRAEDLTGVIGVVLIPFLLLKIGRAISRPLIFLIVGYFIYIFMASLASDPVYFQNISVLFFKELSYFSYFLCIYYFIIRSSDKDINNFFLVIFFLSIPNLLYILFQLLFDQRQGMYGVTFYGHNQSPASSGLIAISLFVISYVYSHLINNNLFSSAYYIFIAIIIFFIGSKIAVVGLLSFLITMLLLERNKKKLISAFFLLALMFVSLQFTINSNIGSLHRLDAIFSPIEVIVNRGIWFKIEWIDSFISLVFGGGLAMGHINNEIFYYGMAMDNQFLYFIIVLGIIGTLIFTLFLLLIILIHRPKTIQKNIQISLIISYLVMGMGAEIFQLSISGILFWTISGFLLASSRKASYIKSISKIVTNKI